MLAAVILVLVVVVHTKTGFRPPGSRPLDGLGYALMVLAALPLTVRRLWPPVTLAVVVVALAAYFAAGYPHGPILATIVIAMYTVATRMPLLRSGIACAVAVVVLFSHVFIDLAMGVTPGVALSNLVWAGWLLLPWAAGTAVRAYRDATARAREEAARDRAYEERLRVAREVHDVVGHGLAAINMQAGVALHVLDRRPEQARNALDAIRQTSKEALDDLRGTLAVFRQPDGHGDRRPEPGLDQLEALVGRVSDGGLPVGLVVTGDPARLPAATDLAAYRIVQEALTNVVRHAGPTAASVRVHYGPAEVDLEVVDGGRGRVGGEPAADGYGIPGMRERAAAVGGTLDTGPRPEGGFRVHARLPLRDSSS